MPDMQTSTPVSTPQPVLVFRYNHFDPLWRRCWDRDFHDAGRRFVSYRAIEEAWISDAIASCADGTSCFMVECSWVLRHYLERHPEHLKTVRQLAREGRFELLGSGENIVDTNLIHGELLTRNLVLGTLWAEATLGVRPTTGWHSDGFGSSAQMPQIFRQCGYDWIPSMSYNTPDAPYWRGLDGSAIFFSNDMLPAHFGPAGRLPHRQGTTAYIYQKLPPCPNCRGTGCQTCDGKGFARGDRAEFTAPPTAPLPGDVAIFQLWGEEIQPGLHVAAAIAAANARDPRFLIRQGVYRDLRPYLAAQLAAVDAPPADRISSKVENNPSQSGCYVSRIKIKQQHRAAEHALLAAECWDALLQNGAQTDALRKAWRDMTLSAFHDSITSSHCDPAYEELLDLQHGVQALANSVSADAVAPYLTPQDAAFTVFNHHDRAATVPVTVQLPGKWAGATADMDDGPLPVYAVRPGTAGSTAVTVLARQVPALGARTLRLTPAPANPADTTPLPAPNSELACGPYTLRIGENGVSGVSHTRFGEVMKPGVFHFGEPILEHDLGDLWSTRSRDRTREHLAPFTRLTAVVRTPHGITVTYAGRHPSIDNPHFCADPQVTYLTWQQSFQLREDVSWLEVETQVEWHTQSRRLRLAFPSISRQNRGVYEIPYGVLERERYEGIHTHGGNAGGDWPALHWAGLQIPGYTYAIFNRGTPSYRVEDGTVLVSVLRSPEIPYCLSEPAAYVAHNYGGMLDAGTHHFRHALYIGPGDWRDNDTGCQARLFQAPPLAVGGALAAPLPGWGFTAAHTQLTAVKKPEDGRGIVLRFVETAGQSEVIRLRPAPAFRGAVRCNLLEEDQTTLAIFDDGFSFTIAPWQIATIRLLTE